MSYQSEYRVWELSKQKGSHLLVLVRLANQANDAGVAWPARSKLAQTCRLTTRRIEQIANEIADSGEMAILKGGLGRGDTNHYIILVGRPETIAQKVLALTDEYNARMGEKISPIRAGKGEILDEERAKLLMRKGEILRLLEHILLEHHKLEKSGADKPRRATRPADDRLKHPAIIQYRDICHRTPNELQRQAIIDSVGDEPTRLELYAQVLRDWILSGWNPGNVAGQLDALNNGGIKNGRGRSNGRGSKDNRPAVAGVSPDELQRQQELADRINARRDAQRARSRGDA